MIERYPFINTPLPYSYDALEPFIDQKTMELHHDKHLQTYIDNLNKALAPHPFLQKMSLTELLCNVKQLPPNMQMPIKNNAGGVYNHRMYFDGMINNALKEPMGTLALLINRQYGSFDELKRQLTEAALSVFGSGYAWLVSDENGMLRIITTANQDTPLPLGFCPVLVMDVWEHAYYLKHYNKRADYIADWFWLINWKQAEANYTAILASRNAVCEW